MWKFTLDGLAEVRHSQLRDGEIYDVPKRLHPAVKDVISATDFIELSAGGQIVFV